MPAKAAQPDLLGEDDVDRVLGLVLPPAPAAHLLQQVLPLLPDQLAVLCVSQPRLASAKEHDARGAQNNQAGEQGQHAKAHQLPVGDQDALRVHRLLQGDFEEVPVRRAQQLVEGVSREGVVLRCERENPMLHRLRRDRLDSHSGSVLERTGGTRKPLLAKAAEGPVRLPHARAAVSAGPTGARRQVQGVVASEAREIQRAQAGEGQAVVGAGAAVEAGVGLAAVHVDLAVVPREARGAHAGGKGGRAVHRQTRAAVLTGRSVLQTQAFLQMAVVSGVAVGADAQVAALACLDAGGVGRAGA